MAEESYSYPIGGPNSAQPSQHSSLSPYVMTRNDNDYRTLTNMQSNNAYHQHPQHHHPQSIPPLNMEASYMSSSLLHPGDVMNRPYMGMQNVDRAPTEGNYLSKTMMDPLSSTSVGQHSAVSFQKSFMSEANILRIVEDCIAAASQSEGDSAHQSQSPAPPPPQPHLETLNGLEAPMSIKNDIPYPTTSVNPLTFSNTNMQYLNSNCDSLPSNNHMQVIPHEMPMVNHHSPQSNITISPTPLSLPTPTPETKQEEPIPSRNNCHIINDSNVLAGSNSHHENGMAAREKQQEGGSEDAAEAEALSKLIGLFNMKQRKQAGHPAPPPQCNDICKIKTTVIPQKKPVVEKTEADKQYMCEVCALQFNDLAVFNAHQKSHEAKLYTSLLTKSKEHELKEKPYKCGVCWKEFATMHTLQEHERIHRGEKPYHCMVCGKHFTHLAGLSRHKKLHSGEKAHRCQECGKTFTHKSKLVDHKRIHTGETPYSCNLCGKKFKQHAQVWKHIKVHTGERPHKCDKCALSFYYKYDLETHKKRVHLGTKDFMCIECGEDFIHRSQLMRHQEKEHQGRNVDETLINGPSTPTEESPKKKRFPCKECNKTFAFKSSLDKHALIHEGIKPYPCPQCEEGFMKKSHLTNHIMHMHADPTEPTGLHSVECQHCHMEFPRDELLKEHQKQCPVALKAYKCNHCHQEFSTQAEVNRHVIMEHPTLVAESASLARTEGPIKLRIKIRDDMYRLQTRHETRVKSSVKDKTRKAKLKSKARHRRLEEGASNLEVDVKVKHEPEESQKAADVYDWPS